MQLIAEWLERLGLSEYTERFAENRIDLSIITDLTDQHLKELGIALGDRLKMLRAIRELNDPFRATPQSVFTELTTDEAPTAGAAKPLAGPVVAEPTGE